MNSNYTVQYENMLASVSQKINIAVQNLFASLRSTFLGALSFSLPFNFSSFAGKILKK
jgi:hypothetical protein